MRKCTKIGLGIIAVVTSLASYRFGIHVSMDAFEVYSTDSQAMFAFNHLGNYSEIKKCLENGKVEAASIKLDNFIITERELLADHLHTGVSPRMIEYINVRSEESLEAYQAFKSNRGSSWSVPSCE